MVDGERAWGSVQVKSLESAIELVPGARWEMILGLKGAARVEADGKSYRLQPGELIRLDDAQGSMLAIRPVEPRTCLAHIAIDPESPAA